MRISWTVRISLLVLAALALPFFAAPLAARFPEARAAPREAASSQHRLLAAVREVNRRLPAGRRLRVLAGDAPIDWGKVHTRAEWAAFQPNDAAFADVISREVLAKHHRALVILGGNHLTKGGDRNGRPDTTTRVEQRWPGSLFVVLLHTAGSRGAEERMAAWRVPALMSVRGTWLAALPRGPRRLDETCDALLYLGAGSSLRTAEPDWNALTADELAEIDRRHRIQFACPLNLGRWKRGQRPCP